jgi:amino acid transporter
VPILITTVIGTALFLLSNVATDLYILMVNFTSGGFYLSFLFPVLAFVIAVFGGKWKAGPFSLGKASGFVGVLALVWIIFELLNIAWPRPFWDNPWLDWSVVVGAVGIGIVGVLIYLSRRSRILSAKSAVDKLDAADSK